MPAIGIPREKGSSLLLTHVAILCLRRSVRGQRNEARAMAIYVCRRVGGMKEEELANLLPREERPAKQTETFAQLIA